MKAASGILTTILFFVTSFVLLTACEKRPEEVYKVINSRTPPSPEKAQITGKVLLENRVPQNVKVMLCEQTVDMPFTAFECKGKVAETTTDQDGVYWLRDIKPGNYELAMQTPGSKPAYFVLKRYETVNGKPQLPLPITIPVKANQTIEIKTQTIYDYQLK